MAYLRGRRGKSGRNAEAGVVCSGRRYRKGVTVSGLFLGFARLTAFNTAVAVRGVLGVFALFKPDTFQHGGRWTGWVRRGGVVGEQEAVQRKTYFEIGSEAAGALHHARPGLECMPGKVVDDWFCMRC